MNGIKGCESRVIAFGYAAFIEWRDHDYVELLQD